MNAITTKRYDYYALLAFAFCAVASIALENFIWVSIVLFLYLSWKNKTKIDWPRDLFSVAALVFLCTFLLGSVVGIDPTNSFHSVHKYLTFLILFPVGAMALSKADIQKFFNFFIAGATICAIAGIGKHFFLNEDRIDSFSGDKMVFGGMLMISFLIAILFLKKNPKNVWFWIATLSIGFGLILTETRGAWVGATFGFGLLAWRLNKKMVLVGALIMISLFFVAPKEYQDRVTSIANLHYHYNLNMKNHEDEGKISNASTSRLLIWLSGIRIIQDHPWGVGQGNISEIYPKYRIPNLYLEPTVPHLHNNYLQITAQNGWLGLIAYLFWIFAFYYKALRFRSTDPDIARWNWLLLCIFSSVLVWGLSEYTFSQQFMNIQFTFLGLTTLIWKNYASSETQA